MNAQFDLLPEQTTLETTSREKYIEAARKEAIFYALRNGTVSSDVLLTPRPPNVHCNAAGAIFKMPSMFRAVAPKKSEAEKRNGGFIWIWELVSRENAVKYLNGISPLEGR